MEPRESLNQACAEQKESSRPHTRRLRNGLSVAREVRNESELNITQHYHSSGDEQISLLAPKQLSLKAFWLIFEEWIAYVMRVFAWASFETKPAQPLSPSSY